MKKSEMMGGIRHKAAVSRIAIATVMLAGTFYLIAGAAATVPKHNSESKIRERTTNAAPAPSASLSEPAIAWSPTSTLVVLAPGQSNSEDFTFTSGVDLAGVVVEPAPEIAPFLTVQPSSFSAVPAGKSEGIEITFSVPPSTAVGLYSGTVHIKSGNTTIPQTLKVSVAVGTSFSSSSLHLSFVMPPLGASPQAQVTQRSDGATQILISALNANDQQPVPEFELTLYPNPTLASLHDWFEQNVDASGVLLSSNAFTLQQFANGPALVLTGPIPTQYQGGPMDAAYAPSPSGDAIMSVAQSQVNDMGSEGYSQQQITDLLIGMLATVQSF